MHVKTRDKAEKATKEDLFYSTRLFIKNLPQNLTSDELRAFIESAALNAFWPESSHGHEFGLTDCRVLHQANGKSRRMAFVGLVSAAQAAACLNYLDKCYCQNCRLAVSYARVATPNGTAVANTATDRVTNEILKDVTTVSGKETESTLVLTQKAEVDFRKREFLAVMGAKDISSTKSERKFWSNDDDGNVGINNIESINATSNKQPAYHAKPNPPESKVNDDDDNTTDDESSDEDENDDKVDPLQHYQSRALVSSDLEFLQKKKTAAENLDSDSDSDNDDDVSDESGKVVKHFETKNDANDFFEEANNLKEHDRINGFDNEKRSIPLSTNHDDLMYASSKTSSGVFVADNNNHSSSDSNRLFVRNLPFSASEKDLEQLFQPFGRIEECHLPIDDQKRPKGFGYITFARSQDARAAKEALDGSDFQGRLLHILAARPMPVTSTAIANPGNSHASTYKQQQDVAKRQAHVSSTGDQAGWSASFVRGDAVVDTLAERLGLRKGDILAVKDGLSSGDAAVRLALGETAVIEENRNFFADHGYDMETLVSYRPNEGKEKPDDSKSAHAIKRCKTSILVKNLPADTNKEDLFKMFTCTSGGPVNVLLAPSRTIAVVEYSHSNDAKSAFRRLAYRRYKTVPLYIEWAPLSSKIDITTVSQQESSITGFKSANSVRQDSDLVDSAVDEILFGPSYSIYVKNLSFDTSEEKLLDFFRKHVDDVRAVRLPKKVEPQQSGETRSNSILRTKSMGFGFVEFGSLESVQKVLKLCQGTILDGHALELKLSSNAKAHQVSLPASEVGNTKATKLMVRNVPFQANRTELLQLFGSFGQLKKVRLPKKFDGGHRGFAFIEYRTSKDAAAAMKSLSRTHLYGRHLVLEWAAADDVQVQESGTNNQNQGKFLAHVRPNKKSRVR